MVTIFTAACAGCRQSASPAKPADSSVKVDSPKKKTLRRVIEQPATIEPFQEAPLVARIPGYVLKVEKDIDEDVKEGNLLAELSVPDLMKEHAQKQALVAQAKAEVEQAKAQVGEADAGIARADANQERWDIEYTRVMGLYKDKVVEKQILDETLHQFKAAKASRQEAGARLQKANADVAVARARVSVAEAEEGRLKAMADFRFIVAPFDGVVTRRNVHKGHFLQPVAGGSVLFVVAQVDKLRISADIPENEAGYMTEKLAAKIHVPALDGPPLDGTIARTSRTLDPKTRTLRVEIDYVTKNGKLRPGMYANLVFTIDLGEHYTLPASAIFTHADKPCCWRVDADGKAVRTPLKLGLRDSQDVEVLEFRKDDTTWVKIADALTERFVVTNRGAVSEGKEVRIQSK
jgi:multidrug efflux pump subunit AcrA (membrane-fusion protein)